MYYDILAVDLFTVNEIIRIISVYAPPSLKIGEYEELMEEIKSLAVQHKIIIVGDFNLGNIKWTVNETFALNSKESHLLELIKTLELNQIVRQPTRGNHILDLIFIGRNMDSNNLEVLDPPMNHKTGKPVSDHRQIRFKTPIKLNAEVLTPKLNYFKSNYTTMNWKMNQINWNCILEGLSTELIYQKVTKLIQKFIHDFTPTNLNKKRKLPSHITNCIEKRDRLQLTDPLKYSKVISELTRIIHKKLVKYDRNREAAALNNDPMKIYAHIKKATKPTETIPNIHDKHGKLAINDQDKADLFKQYFSSVFKTSNYQCLPKKEDGSSELYKWNEANCWNILKKLPAKVNSSIDGIPNVILRNCCFAIAQPVTMLFNSIIQNEVIPDEMKTSIMIPIHKKGSKHILTNWRGINLQSSMAKLLDKYLNKIFMEHVEKNNIIPRQQHGFTKNKSVTTNLLEALELITKTMDQNKPSYCVYFDISKAFDLVDHGLLLNKLYNDDIDPKLFKLLEQFINGRKFKVKINNTYSELGQMSSGVPQGSTLGPNLFNYYISDLPNICHVDGVNVLIFADDIKAISNDPGLLQEFINKLSGYCNHKKLTIAADKTYFMRFSSSKLANDDSTNFYLDNKLIKEENSHIRDLGVLITPNLNWNLHINKICQIAKWKLLQLFRYVNTRNTKILVKLYKVYIRPNVEFATQVFNGLSRKQADRIESVQKLATRMIIRRKQMKYINYEERLRELNMETLETRRMNADIKLFSKILNNPSICQIPLLRNQNNTRRKNMLIKPKWKKTIRKLFFSVRIHHLIKLPTSQRQTN